MITHFLQKLGFVHRDDLIKMRNDIDRAYEVLQTMQAFMDTVNNDLDHYVKELRLLERKQQQVQS